MVIYFIIMTLVYVSTIESNTKMADMTTEEKKEYMTTGMLLRSLWIMITTIYACFTPVGLIGVVIFSASITSNILTGIDGPNKLVKARVFSALWVLFYIVVTVSYATGHPINLWEAAYEFIITNIQQ
jgi:hypothetical protein